MEPIAIIGIGCRFPKANSPDAFWQLLRNGQRAISPIPAERWPVEAYYDPSPLASGKMNARLGGFIDGVDCFDAAFFSISDEEAPHIDPQQRLFLEVAWEALEHAGIAPRSLAGSATGVFSGLCTIDYHRLLYRNFEQIGPHSGTGTTMSITANRLSYLLDLRGPSMAIDAACASSLVGVHLACQSLRAQESHLCIVGGVNLILSPDSMISSAQTGLLSRQGQCRPFDAAADGYVRGEGCGVVILKRLQDALAEGDNVLAVVRGSAINQDGLSNSLTAPNGLAQQALLQRALEISGVSPTAIDYIEAHAVGTPLGDAIEFKALKKVLGGDRPRPCVVGSLKPNIGHLEAASGMAALIKVILSLQHGEIPPQLNFEQANAYVELERDRIEIAPEGRPWQRNGHARCAGISTFGFGGTNAHLVVEEAPPVSPRCSIRGQDDRSHHLLTLTAKSPAALRNLAKRYHDYLSATLSAELTVSSARSPAPLALADICFTANTGRTHFAHRLCLVSDSPRQLQQQLAQFAEGEDRLLASQFITGKVRGRKRPKVAFFFPQWSLQTLAMGRQLYDSQPYFREVVDECAQLAGHDLCAISVSDTRPSTQRLCAFVYTYALAKLWQQWGIVPKAVMGQGESEYVAACVAGMLSLEQLLPALAKGRSWYDLSLNFLPPRLPLLSHQHSELLEQAIAGVQGWGDRSTDLSQLFPLTGLAHYDLLLAVGMADREDDLLERKPSAHIQPGRTQALLLQADLDLWPQLLIQLGQLFVKGIPVDWRAFERGYPRQRVALPTYPFERTSHWFVPLAQTSELLPAPKESWSNLTQANQPPDLLAN